MKKEKKGIVEILRSLFKKHGVEEERNPETPSQETVEKLMSKALGEPGENSSSAEKSSGSGLKNEDPETENVAPEAEKKGQETEKKESCPYATKRAIVNSIAEIKRFAEENKLAASVVKALLTLLVEIALGALKGKVSRQVLEALLKALNYEMAMEEAYRQGELKGRNEMTEERFPSRDDGLPHLNGTILRGESTSIFDVAAAARR